MSGGWGTPSWMKFKEPEMGETFVSGKDPETARGLLDAADAIGADRKTDVRAVTGGFIVTDAVYDRWAAENDGYTDL